MNRRAVFKEKLNGKNITGGSGFPKRTTALFTRKIYRVAAILEQETCDSGGVRIPIGSIPRNGGFKRHLSVIGRPMREQNAHHIGYADTRGVVEGGFIAPPVPPIWVRATRKQAFHFGGVPVAYRQKQIAGMGRSWFFGFHLPILHQRARCFHIHYGDADGSSAGAGREAGTVSEDAAGAVSPAPAFMMAPCGTPTMVMASKCL